MSAPGEQHEARVALLDACAVLTGHVTPCRLAAGEVPDVVRADVRHRRLFVADAKATETPGCAATRERMHAYARALKPWLDRGFAVRLALCHGRPDQAPGWAALLEHAADCAGLDGGRGDTEDLEPGTVLTWLDLAPCPQTTQPAAGPAVLGDVGPGR